MSITIPRLNSQTKASTTPAVQTAVQSDIRYRDMGLDDFAVDAMKKLGGAAVVAKENKDNGMANATINEFHRRMNEWYTEATTGNLYKGYDSEKLMPDMKKFAQDTIDDLKMNGFTKADKSTVVALSDDVFENKFLPSIDSMLIGMYSNATGYASRENAVAAENDFNAAVDRVVMTILKADDPIMQANGSIELDGLFKAYYGGRMSDEARGVAVSKVMNTTLATIAKTLASEAPAKALHEFNTNENYKLYNVDLSEARKSAVETMATLAGTNEAMATNGMPSLDQNWSDVPLGENSNPVLKNRYPYSAAGLMTPEEYAAYSFKKAEVWNSKSAAISNEIRRSKIDRDTTLLSELGKAESQDEYNKIVEDVVERGDAHSLDSLTAMKAVKDSLLAYKNQADIHEIFSNPDGSFNENMATQYAYESMDRLRPEVEPDSEEYNESVRNYVELQRTAFDERKEFLEKQSANAVSSARALSKVQALLYDDSEGGTIQTVEDMMPYIKGMTPADANAAADAIIARAQTKKQAMALAKNEGGTFDVYKVASEQWKALGHEYKFEDGKLSEGDPEARERFISRFVELYIRKHSAEKPNAKELEDLTIEAYNTYVKAPRHEDVSRFSNTVRRMAAESYGMKSSITSYDVRNRVREFLETGGVNTTKDELKKKIQDLRVAPKVAAYMMDQVNSDLLKKVDFEDDTYAEYWDSLVEIYNESEYTDKETLIDFISFGDDSALLRILKQKGKF